MMLRRLLCEVRSSRWKSFAPKYLAAIAASDPGRMTRPFGRRACSCGIPQSLERRIVGEHESGRVRRFADANPAALMADIKPLIAVTVGVAIDVFQFDFHFVPGLFHLAGSVHHCSSIGCRHQLTRLAENDGAVRPHARDWQAFLLRRPMARLIWASVQITRVVILTRHSPNYLDS